MADLSVNVAGVKFKNPCLVGSASPSMDWKGCKKGIDGGCSGVIVKSLFGEQGKLGRSFPRPRFKLYDYKTYPGYPAKLPHAFTLNSLEECSHFGYQEYMDDVNRAKDAVGDEGRIMASLSGVTLDEWEEMCGLVNKTSADWVELNVSCPFAADMGVKMGAGAVDMTADVVRTCARLLKKPFSVKVSPQTVDQSSVALACQEAGAMAINLSARFSGFDLDIDTARPIGAGAQGGWGGPYFIGYGLKNCALAANKLSVPIIAGLGVWDWRDIIKYTMVGASLVQSGVGLMLQGYDIAHKWNENINEWLDGRGYKSLDEIRGIALPNILKTAEVVRAPEGVHAKVNYDKCTKCGVCKRSCFYDAITLTRAGAVIDTHKCDGCGMCVEVCPADAVSMTAPQQRVSK